jgi:2-polyprenyl-3-methyl-5-hydroxy-6-metoxy-1,4-benzoquinol methylase
MIRRVSSDSLPWTLGDLPAGWEWFAFTFRDQPPLELTKEEIEEMLATAEDVTRQAYARMSLTKEHKWKRHAGNEAKFIVRECRLPRGSTVLDLGCGDGRHSIALSTMGCRVLGVDYVESLIERARAASRAGRLPDVRFETDDARTFDAGEVFDSVNCLYDVIGSFGDKSSNFQIVRNVAKHLKPGGRALVSVMNRVLTEKNAIHRFTFSGEPNRLLALHASRTMETSGNVFDPRFYLIDTDTGVVYRKEQFENGTDLPAEYIVSDRRFTPKEIADQFRAVGLQVETVKCVRAGDWETALADDDDRAKEILVLCRKGE